MSRGLRFTLFKPLSKRLGTTPRVSLSLSMSLEPTPVSTSTFLPFTWRSKQFSPRVIRFFRSVTTLFSQAILGTGPNIEPPSSLITPSFMIFTAVDIITDTHTLLRISSTLHPVEAMPRTRTL